MNDTYSPMSESSLLIISLLLLIFQATLALNSHWSVHCADGGGNIGPTSDRGELDLDSVKAFAITPSDSQPPPHHCIQPSVMEERISKLHVLLENALGSFRSLLTSARSEQVPMGKLDLNETDLGHLLLRMPLPYGATDQKPPGI